MRPLVAIVGAMLVAIAGALEGRAQTAAATQSVSLADLERLALERHPALGAAEAAIESERARARQAGAWPNPTVGVDAEEIAFGGDEPRGAYGVFAEQTLVLGGKRRLGRAVFESAGARAEAERDRERQRILGAVRSRFYETLALERRVEVHERLATLAAEAVGVTAQLFNVGAADRPDFLEIEIESRRVVLELEAARDRVRAARQQLSALVGAEDVAAAPLAGSIDDPLPAIDRQAALAGILDGNPAIRIARARIAEARAATALARRESFPDLFLRGGAAYNRERWDAGAGAIGWEASVEAGVRVPLFNRNAGAIGAAQADERRADAELQRLEQSLRAGLAAEHAAYLTAAREAEAYRTEILPRAEEAYRLYLARYKEMGAAYPQVLVAQRSVFDLSARYLESVAAAWRSALRIQSLLAGNALEMD